MSFIFAVLLFQVQLPVLDPNAEGFSILNVAKVAQDGAQAKNWGLLIVAILFGSVWLIRMVAKKFPTLGFFAWVLSQQGGWTLNLVGSGLMGLITMFAAGPVTVSSVLGALGSALITSLATAGAVNFQQDLKAKAQEAGASAAAAVPDAAAGVEVFKKGPQP